MTSEIINEHVLDALKKMPDESVDCVITSPPYYGLRSYKGAETVWGDDPNCAHEWGVNISERIDYTGFERNREGLNKSAETIDGHKRSSVSQIPPVIKNSSVCSKCGAWKGQLGLEPSYEMYLDHLLMVTAELKRVLKKTGTLFWNMGDTYVGGHIGGSFYNKEWNISKADVIPQIKQGRPQSHVEGMSEKSLMMLPERFAIEMIDQGWILRNKIVWRKCNAMPSSIKDRYSNKWEYVFFFVKSKKYFFDLNAVRKPLADPDRMLRGVSGKRLSQQDLIYAFFGNPPRGINKPRPNIKHDLAVNRKGSYGDPLRTKPYNLKGANPGDVIDTPAVRYKSWYSNAGHEYTHDRKYDIHEDGGDFLDIPTRPHRFAHFAVYPTTLIVPLVKSGCPPQGVVLDPFAGSGTTGVVAEILGRNSILIEISKEYVEIIKERLQPNSLKKEGEALNRYEAKFRGVKNDTP